MPSVPLGFVKQSAGSSPPESGEEKPDQRSAVIEATKFYARQAIAAREVEAARVRSRMEKRHPGFSERQSMYLRLLKLRRVVYLREATRARAIVSLDLAAALMDRARQVGRSSRARGRRSRRSGPSSRDGPGGDDPPDDPDDVDERARRGGS